MTDRETYIKGILDELERVRARNGKGVFRINERISDSLARDVRAYFQKLPEYHTELRKCAKCTNSWDIMITFKSTTFTVQIKKD